MPFDRAANWSVSTDIRPALRQLTPVVAFAGHEQLSLVLSPDEAVADPPG
jgi:hypothetical protein